MKYDGGKNGAGVYQRLISMMPPHKLYIEMFMGSGAILRRKRPADQSIAYELDRSTIREIMEHLPPEQWTPSAITKEWNGVDALPGCGGTSVIFYRPGDLRYEQKLEIFNVDAVQAIKAKFSASSYTWGFYDPGEVLIYADPPYPNDVRSHKGGIYKFEMMQESEHAELCDVLLSIPCKIMLSGYENDLYNDKLKGWRKETIPTTNRAGTKVIETVWLNFPEPMELHDYSFAGDNHRDRWNFTKRLRNWTGQLDAMRPAERGRMLDALVDLVETYRKASRAADREETAKAIKRAAKFEAKLSRRPATPIKASTPARETELFT